MEFIILVLILGAIPAMIASSKGRSFLGWYVYGVLLFIIALVHSLLLRDERVTDQALKRALLEAASKKRCSSCAEPIQKEALVCRYCGRDQPAIAESVAS